MTNASRIHFNRRALLKSAAAGTAAALAAPMIARADSKSIKIGMSTILSGRVAQLGTSSRNAVMTECSFGFRPGRSAHQALQSLHTAIMSQGLQWVVELPMARLRSDFSVR